MDEGKNVHYTERERLLLAQLVSEESLIDCKKTGAVDLKQKADAWERVTKKFISEGCAPRTSKQLRKCWDNLKQKKRKLTTIMKHQRLMTGGGPAPVERVDPVMDFMDGATGNIDVEIDCPFDSTAAFERDYDMGFMNESLTVQDQDEDISSEIIESHPENRSHRQVSSHLTSASKKRDTSHENLKNISDEKVLRLIRLREAIEQQRELHAKKIKIAEAEEKIAILKLLKLEEELKSSRLKKNRT